jgi:hypothetical protein
MNSPIDREQHQSDASSSISACIRFLYSSDQWAPGFRLGLPCGRGIGDASRSLGVFCAPTFSLSVTRDDVGLEDEFELFMQLLGTYFNLLRCSCWHAPLDLTSLGYQRRRLCRSAAHMQKRCSD